MRRRLAELLESRWTLVAAASTSLLLGLFFSFVWAPHPWGWRGIDQYHELARALARGEPFGTTDVPWGYAYYVAAWYSVFGEHVWLPVLGQVILNALVPLLLYELVRVPAGKRIATLAALLAGIFSFNTIYASTLSSDALCTVLFLAALVCFARGHRAGSASYFAASGLLAGLVPQFRPNLVLLPLIIGGLYAVAPRRSMTRLVHVFLFLFIFAAALAPWTVRNYRLTGQFLPTSTHGGMQLWYGSLQVGPYLENRAGNPRAAFEWAGFPYTSLTETPILVSADRPACAPWQEASAQLVFWTDRQREPIRLAPRATEGPSLLFDIPGQPAPTAVYYFLEAHWPGSPGANRVTPAAGADRPFVYFVDTNHLGDLDRHDDLLDIFDLVRLARHVAWDDPLPRPDLLDLDRSGRVDAQDVHAAVTAMMPAANRGALVSIEPAAENLTLRLVDGSSLSIPRQWSGRITDMQAEGGLAGSLVATYLPFAGRSAPAPDPGVDPCRALDPVRINDVFYRKEVHQMRRYVALAMDNIRRDPAAFAASSAYRAFRLFVIRATDDWRTSHQFAGSGVIYGAGQALSAGYFAIFLAGVVMAWRRRSPLLVALVPIVYVPATICFVLTNMRYTTTVQPLMFAFVAFAIVTLLRLDEPASPPN